MSAPVLTTAWMRPASIMRTMTVAIFATVIAPEKVATTRQSGSFAMAVSTSAASPSARPLNAVFDMARTRSSHVRTARGSSEVRGSR